MSSLPDLSIWTRSSKVESIHPIRDDYKLTKTVTFKGAKCLYVKFDPRCATQYQYDKVLITQWELSFILLYLAYPSHEDRDTTSAYANYCRSNHTHERLYGILLVE